MAITNAQQFKQLVNPPMKGKKRPGYRGDDAYGGGTTAGGSRSGSPGDRGDGPASRDFGGPGRDERMGMKGKTRPGRNPMAQFSRDVDTTDLTFMDEKRRAVNPLGFLTEIPGITGGLFRTLTPNPFGFSAPDFVNQEDRERSGISILPFLFPKFQERSQTMEEEDEDEEDKNLRKLRLAFRAEGGSMNDQIRQAYGLGSIVKKATRAVKKVAKSDLGKAAITAAALYYMPKYGVKAQGGLPAFLQGAKTGIQNLFLGAPIGSDVGGNIRSGGILNFVKNNPFLTIAGASVLAGLMTPKQEAEAQALANDEGIDIEEARRSILNAGTPQDFRALAFKAEGGSIKEPVAKKTMPLLDMGGQEMDLRAEGGFVPIGRMEKADDVPARLSKNEFVFTADAVRNAGDGDVDKGAEVMYNMMKNLEAGGDVSEESQGLEGARRMFQTSQRLEEVL
jgi:hypothetical protein